VTSSYRPATIAGQPVAAFIGDSYTFGGGASEPQKRWTSLVSQRMGWVEHNFGRDSTGYWRAFPPSPNYLGMVDAVAADNPDIVVVAGGQNDLDEFVRDSGAVSEAITETYTAIRARLPNSRIIGVGPSSPLGVPPSLVSRDSVLFTWRCCRRVGGCWFG
jgi:lysophospholipase L1-like esterase